MKMIKNVLLIVGLLSFNMLFGQKLIQIGALPTAIAETSGLAFLNDSILITHNDSGDKPLLYLIDFNGKLIRQVTIENASNIDWEDICTDDQGNLYIGDIGNNNNNRKDLKIYKVKAENLLNIESIKAEIITYSYPDQFAFPPIDSLKNFDAEGLAFHNDSLLIFTKCRANPFHGLSYCYKLPTLAGNYTAIKSGEISIGKNGFMKDAVTAATVCQNTLYLLTYNRFLKYNWVNGKWVYLSEHLTKPYSQKEAIITKDNQTMYLTDEVQKIVGGGKLYKMEIK